MSRESGTVPIIVHFPSDPEGKVLLSRQAASAHAEQVIRYIQGLRCPAAQKLALADAILASGGRLPCPEAHSLRRRST